MKKLGRRKSLGAGHWLHYFNRSGCHFQPWFISDDPDALVAAGLPGLRVNIECGFEELTGTPARKAALVVSLLSKLWTDGRDDPFVVCDLDSVIERDFSTRIARFLLEPFCMAEDFEGRDRMVPAVEPFPEKNSGFMSFSGARLDILAHWFRVARSRGRRLPRHAGHERAWPPASPSSTPQPWPCSPSSACSASPSPTLTPAPLDNFPPVPTRHHTSRHNTTQTSTTPPDTPQHTTPHHDPARHMHANPYAKRKDGNHNAFVEEIEKALPGCSVADTSGLGSGFPDAVVGYRGKNFLFEIKDPDKPPSKRRLTPCETRFHANWQGQISTVTTAAEALAAMIPR